MQDSISAVVLSLMASSVAVSSNSSQAACESYQYYNASVGECVHCDTLCFRTLNSAYVAFMEETCAELCPGYIKLPRAPAYPEKQYVQLSVVEGGVLGLMIAVLVLSCIVIFLWKVPLRQALKNCCRGMEKLRISTRCCSSTDVNDRSYVKLADPSDEVEIVYRVTCL